jgi:hypothetical protein
MRTQKSVFYLAARSFTEVSAGIRSMHILCNQLNLLGFDAFLVGIDDSFATNQSLTTPLLTRALRDDHIESGRKVVAIYDESIQGNPLKGHVSVQWLLNRSGYLSGRIGNKNSPNTWQFVYAKEIDTTKPRLFVNSINYNFFKNYQIKSMRDLTLFYAGKLKALGIDVPKPKGAVEIYRSGPKKQSREELRDLFSRAKVLYLAEDSAMALEAAICGCPTVHLTQFFQNGPLSQEDGGVDLAVDHQESSLRSVNLDSAFIARYFATLELRTLNDVLNFAVRVQAHLVDEGKIGKPRYKIPNRYKFLMRLNKVLAGYKNSGFKGVFGVLSSHIDFIKKGS